MPDFQSLVETKLEPVSESANDIVYRCPQCDDKSGHLYVNYNRGYWHCFKCNVGGRRIESLLRLLNIDVNFDYDRLYNDQNNELDSIISIRNQNPIISESVDYSKDLNCLTQYYREHIKPLSKIAYDYLLNRGLIPSIISKLCICEGINRYGENISINGKDFIGRDYSGRIMIPSLRRDGLISFYVGRDYIGDKSAKYVNPPKTIAVASEDVWSLDTIETNSVVICEGVMTSIAVDQALGKHISCATYGKSISKKSSNIDVNVTSQGEKLLARKFDQYIVFYDKDAKKEADSTAKYLYDRGAIVRVVSIPDDMYGPKADAADMTKEEIIDCIENAALFDIFTGLV